MGMTQDELNKLIHNTDALIWGHWNETETADNKETTTGATPVTYGQSVELTLQFLDPLNRPFYLNSAEEQSPVIAKFGAGYTERVVAFSAPQQAAALAAFDAWASYANISRTGTRSCVKTRAS